jgi:hypothetical protein
MKAWKWVLMAAGVSLCLTACGTRISEPVAEELLADYLPEEYTTVTVDGEPLSIGDIFLEVTDRTVDLRHQTDDVTCQVTLSGEEGELTYDCELHFAYLREQGWEIRSYELDGEPTLTLTSEEIRQNIRNQAESALEEEYQEVELQEETWSDSGDQYTLLFSLGNTQTYLEEQGQVKYTGTLVRRGSGFDYVWKTEEPEPVLTAVPLLEDTIWHIAAPEERVEAAFQITQVENGELSLSGVVRSENWVGYIKEKTLEGTAEWTVSSYDCISFDLPQINGTTLSCNIQSDRQWANLDGVYLGELEEATMPESGSLSDLMELEIESWMPSVQPESPEPEESTQPEEPSEPTSDPVPVPETPQEVQSWWDYLMGLFGF